MKSSLDLECLGYLFYYVFLLKIITVIVIVITIMHKTLGRNFLLSTSDIRTQGRTFSHELHLYQKSKCTDAESAYLAILYLGWPITHWKCDKGKLKVKSARQPINQAYIFLSPLACKEPRYFKTRF